MRMTRRISVVNQKGGVGKTTTAVNLAVALAMRGNRVLLIDYDPQANASNFLGFVSRLEGCRAYTASELTLGVGSFAPATDVLVGGLDLVPATQLLASLETRLASKRDALKRAVDRIAHRYDFVLADCAPTLGMLAVNAMIACPDVVLPVRLEPASIPGALRTQATVEALRRTANPSLRLLGTLGTFLKETGLMARQVSDQVGRVFGPLMFDTRIHQSDAVGRSAGKGLPILLDAPRRRESLEYQQFTQEVIARGS
jgi:chromosome partitioning protein